PETSNWPRSSLTASRVVPVPRFLMTMDTPGSTAPELSCTTPTIFPVLVCARASAGRTIAESPIPRRADILILVMVPSLVFAQSAYLGLLDETGVAFPGVNFGRPGLLERAFADR